MVVLLGILLGAAYYGWQTIVEPAKEHPDAAGPDTSPTPTCVRETRYHKGETIKARHVRVNVYNAGNVTGLAGDTLTDLHDKGFRRGEAANPPGDVTASNVTIFAKNKRGPKVLLVKRQFRGKVRVRHGPNLGRGVDVVIGSEFRGVLPYSRTTLTVKHKITRCGTGKNPGKG